MAGCSAGLLCYGGLIVANFLAQKERAFRFASEQAGCKGILNIGSGCLNTAWSQYVCTHAQVVANIDLEGGGPNFLPIDLEQAVLPFRDKEFGSVYASHVLEHLDNWEAALNEWARVADWVIIVIPHPLSIAGWLAPEHRQHFSYRDKGYMEARWPNVKVYM